MILVVMTNKTAIKTRLLRSSVLWLWLHRKNAKIRVIVKIELPSRRKILAVNRNLSLNSCLVLLRVKSTYSLTVACIGLGRWHWMQWCRSLLNIGGNNLQFFSKFALFSTLGGMNLDHDFVQVWKFSEYQKKNANRTLFLPEFRWRPKKKRSSPKIKHLFSPILGEDQKKQNKIKKRSPPKIEHFFSPILGEDQKKRSSSREEHFFPQIYAQLYTLSNYWGDTAKLLGGIYPLHPPWVLAPLIESLLLAHQHIFHSHNVVKKTTTLFCSKQCRRQSNRSVRGH